MGKEKGRLKSLSSEELRIAGPRDVIERVRRQFEVEMAQLGGVRGPNDADELSA